MLLRASSKLVEPGVFLQGVLSRRAEGSGLGRVFTTGSATAGGCTTMRGPVGKTGLGGGTIPIGVGGAAL